MASETKNHDPDDEESHGSPPLNVPKLVAKQLLDTADSNPDKDSNTPLLLQPSRQLVWVSPNRIEISVPQVKEKRSSFEMEVHETENGLVVSLTRVACKPGTFPFLMLPAELRVEIYRLAFARQQAIDIRIARPTARYGPLLPRRICRPFGRNNKKGLTAQLLRVNKFIYTEALPVAMSANVFNIYESGYHSFVPLQAFLDLLGQKAATYLTNISITLYPHIKPRRSILGSVTDLLRRCKNLRFLSLDARQLYGDDDVQSTLTLVGGLMESLQKLDKLRVEIKTGISAIDLVARSLLCCVNLKSLGFQDGIIDASYLVNIYIGRFETILRDFPHLDEISLNFYTRIGVHHYNSVVEQETGARARWDIMRAGLGKYAACLESSEVYTVEDRHSFRLRRQDLERSE